MQNDKPTPMTNAQRQHKHRAKRRRELEALRAVVPSTHDEGDLLQQVQRLTRQFEKAAQIAAMRLERITALETDQSAAQALRMAVRTLLVKLSPAARHVARMHLESCGAAQLLDAPEP